MEKPTTPLIYKKMIEVMRDVDFIGKDRKNTQGTGYNFRGIDDVYNALHSGLAKAGVFCTPEVLTRDREERISKAGGKLIWTILSVKYSFYAEDGSFVSSITHGEAMDSGDKGVNKAESAAQKYAFIQIFCIPTKEDKDTENNTPELAPESPKKVEPKIITKTNNLIIEESKKKLLEVLKTVDFKGLQELTAKYEEKKSHYTEEMQDEIDLAIATRSNELSTAKKLNSFNPDKDE